MSHSLLGRPVKSVLWRSLFFFIVLEAMIVAAVEFWPAFRDNMGALKLMGTLPIMQDMLKLVTKAVLEVYTAW